MQLYNLVGQYLTLQTLLDEVANPEDFQVALSQLEGQIQVKAVNVARIARSLEVVAAALKMEIDRLRARMDTAEKHYTWLREYLLQQLTAAGIDKVDDGIINVSLRRSPPSVVEIDIYNLPARFITIIPQQLQPNKRAIIEEWKSLGEGAAPDAIPGAVISADKKYIQIR